MPASVLRSATCGEGPGLGCLGDKGKEGTPEEPKCSGNVSTISAGTFSDEFLYPTEAVKLLIISGTQLDC